MNNVKHRMDYCPYCGCIPTVEKTRRKFYVECPECGPTVRTGYYLTPKEAVRAWNRRLFK